MSEFNKKNYQQRSSDKYSKRPKTGTEHTNLERTATDNSGNDDYKSTTTASSHPVYQERIGCFGYHIEELTSNKTKFKFYHTTNNEALTFENIFELLKHQTEDTSDFINLLKFALKSDEHTNGFFWECPPISKKSKHTAFEFVTIPTMELNRQENYSSFIEHFRKNSDKEVCSFHNLSGDAILIVPLPKSGKNFSHLANFIHDSETNLQKSVWQLVFKNLEDSLKDNRPRWLSTCGLAVPYVHIRIDTIPKYYMHHEYRTYNVHLRR